MEFGKVRKTFQSKKGNSVVFRYPKEEDLEDMLAYANALIAEDTFVDLSGKPITREEEEKWLREGIEQMEKKEKVHLVVEVNGKHAGNAELRRGKLRRSHGAEIGISLAKQYREEGIGTELLRALIDEGRHLGLRLLTLNCFEGNDRALHVYEKLGFKKVGVIPGAILYKEKYIGEVKMYLPLTDEHSKSKAPNPK